MGRAVSSPTSMVTSESSAPTPRDQPVQQRQQSVGVGSTGTSSVDREQVYQWIQELTPPDTREHALIELRLGAGPGRNI